MLEESRFKRGNQFNDKLYNPYIPVEEHAVA
jgi:hypothetical protein